MVPSRATKSSQTRSATCNTKYVLPVAVRSVVEEWRGKGAQAQAGIIWPRHRWIETFPEHRELFLELPIRLDRPAVRKHCLEASATPYAAEEAFLVVMAWGYGTVGYGPYRVERILMATSRASCRLREASVALVTDGPLAGYRALADRSLSNL
jgi:hypothetical protein